MRNKKFSRKTSILSGLILLGVLLALTPLVWPRLHHQLFYLTGEEEPLKQLSGGAQYLLTRLAPPLQTADFAPVQYAGVPPYGVNTFLQLEVEPAKRELAMKLVAEAGFQWIRQEFPWEDIEIHGKGDFEDRRNEPRQSAWNKYDQIVDLADQYGVRVMARLSNPPEWSRADGDARGTFAPPDNLADYGDFVETVARRYKGRIHVYQIWNEPNIYPEWGTAPINAVEYAALLKEGYTRIKAVDPEAVVVMGALAATIELDRRRREGISPGGLSDALFLQQVYDAGGGPYFDVLAMQGYGLWSGPYDRRMQPRVINFSRPLYLRDVMVRNGDAHKAIWLSELAWNATPPESGIAPIYGQVSAEKQGEYAALAYQRMQEEWPWLGVGFYWFLKQASDQELKDGNPQYFFRLLEPDFTPLPAYSALKTALSRPSVIYRGYHQEAHWAISYSEHWQRHRRADAVLGQAMAVSAAGATAQWNVSGSTMDIILLADQAGGQIRFQLDDEPAQTLTFSGPKAQLRLAKKLSPGTHHCTLTTLSAEPLALDAVIVDGPENR